MPSVMWQFLEADPSKREIDPDAPPGSGDSYLKWQREREEEPQCVIRPGNSPGPGDSGNDED